MIHDIDLVGQRLRQRLAQADSLAYAYIGEIYVHKKRSCRMIERASRRVPSAYLAQRGYGPRRVYL